MRSKDRKHVLIVLGSFESGGAERQAVLLAEGLLQKGVNVTVLGFGTEKGITWHRLQQKGIPAICSGFRSKILSGHSSSKVRDYLLYLKYRVKLIFLVRSLKVDIALPFTYEPNVYFCSWFKSFGIIRCFWNQRDGGIGFDDSRIEKLAISRASTVISNSIEGKKAIRKISNREVVIIHNGVNIPAVSSHCCYENVVTVCMISNIHQQKDHLTLLKAWKRVVERKNCKVKLNLIGRIESKNNLVVTETALYSMLLQFINDNGLADSVEFLGEVSDVQVHLQKSQIAVFSSKLEGLPNGVLEAMAAGLPVVATDIEGCREALGFDYAYFSPVEDDQAMADLLLLFINDSNLRQEVGSRNRIRANNEFSIQKMIDRYYELLNV